MHGVVRFAIRWRRPCDAGVGCQRRRIRSEAAEAAATAGTDSEVRQDSRTVSGFSRVLAIRFTLTGVRVRLGEREGICLGEASVQLFRIESVC